jgi:kinetochore protein Mis13/DSN1
LKQEENVWKSLQKKYEPPEHSPLDPTSLSMTTLAISTEHLDDPVQASILASLRGVDVTTDHKFANPEESSLRQLTANTSPKSLTHRLDAILGMLEPTIDVFADGAHKLSQYRSMADRVADRILGTAAERLELRDRASKERSSTKNVSTGDVLGMLAKVGAERERMGR